MVVKLLTCIIICSVIAQDLTVWTYHKTTFIETVWPHYIGSSVYKKVLININQRRDREFTNVFFNSESSHEESRILAKLKLLIET